MDSAKENLIYSWKTPDGQEISVVDLAVYIEILLNSTKHPDYLNPDFRYVISIEEFLKRWFRYDKIFREYEMFLHFIYYVSVFFSHNDISNFYSINSKKKRIKYKFNIYDAITISIVFANKICNDEHFLNTHYAKISGISLQMLNDMEIQMLYKFKFDLHLNAARIKTSNDMIDILIHAICKNKNDEEVLSV